MKSYEIILIAVAVSLFGIRLYKKYYGSGKSNQEGKPSRSQSRDDDDTYEPYKDK